MRGEGPARAEADLNEAVRTTLSMVRRNLPAEVTVTHQFEELPAARFQVGQLSQVVLNLVQNAVEAVGDSGSVTIVTRRDGDRVVLEVCDSGPGVSPASCYQLVRAQGGTIELAPSETVGTTFVVTLLIARLLGDDGVRRD